MSRTDSLSSRLPPSLRRRVRIVGGAFVVGFGVGAVGTLAGGVARNVAWAANSAFLLGALVFGFGLLGWSGSMLAGRAFEEMARRLDSGSDWTERDSRRAMARIGGFGAGAMVAAATLGTLLT
ncbi:DUF7268 family protein [Halopelagius longus]|uniref:Uncharacterized protein n=1 Tax=Halopelagius longus TaxID=1236180 RepID=A0A1H0XQA8_9EURY|nr:hypothetical protein [Halopelagius longus]RDI72008.1 hypothetical protein DWB78_09900 [Halopelagius longus]SDQ04961.1 hypothetical protein SAMN05216278_0085 [Halopelagius longus]